MALPHQYGSDYTRMICENVYDLLAIECNTVYNPPTRAPVQTGPPLGGSRPDAESIPQGPLTDRDDEPKDTEESPLMDLDDDDAAIDIEYCQTMMFYSDKNKDLVLSRLEYFNWLVQLSHYPQCINTDDIDQLSTTDNAFSRLFPELACRCRDVQRDQSCCDDGGYLMMPTTPGIPESYWEGLCTSAYQVLENVCTGSGTSSDAESTTQIDSGEGEKADGFLTMILATLGVPLVFSLVLSCLFFVLGALRRRRRDDEDEYAPMNQENVFNELLT